MTTTTTTTIAINIASTKIARRTTERKDRMAKPPNQLKIDYKNRTYSAIYSVAGDTMIARIPGVDSRAVAIGGRSESEVAQEVCREILATADKAGRLSAF
jgi:hypothetical protein